LRVITSDASGSFTAWGIGIVYEYDGDSKRLNIIHARRYRPLVDIDMQVSTPEFVRNFVDTFERAIQIQALMLSNHATIDLTEIFSEKRLRSYFSNTLHVCALALYLRSGEYASFQKNFCNKHGFATFDIRKTQYRASDTPFYKFRLTTQKQNRIETQGFYMHNCFSALAGMVISDLIFVETQHNFQSAVPIRKIAKKDDDEKPQYA